MPSLGVGPYLPGFPGAKVAPVNQAKNDGPPLKQLCGDKKIDVRSGETCDDGNLKNGDGCNARCEVEKNIKQSLQPLKNK
ncbi:MAG: hypothetical protein ACD_73C00778G0003 [uncultured bacterium]|nr:MAG: hypothetical protein ACD_73C00778G0003 [uncultured bacterium]